MAAVSNPAMRTMAKLTAWLVACLMIAGCGGGSGPKADPDTGLAPPASGRPFPIARLPASFTRGYERAWAQMTQVGAGVAAAVDGVKRAQARHRTVPDRRLAREFAGLAGKLELVVPELQALTPPAKVAPSYRSLSAAALGMTGTLRNFSADAGAHRAAEAAQDLGSYFADAATIDTDATRIFDKLGIK